jgi:hypothetical protein
MPGMFIHQVLFWLKKDAPKDAADRIIADGRSLLGKIPTVRHLWMGRPAMTPREVVDNSYDIGLCVIVDDVAGHDVYQEHPLHKQFIERNKTLWDRVRIFDFVE